MKRRVSYIIFLAGLSILLYPQFRIVINELRFRNQLSVYSAAVEALDEVEITERLDDSHEYNEKLSHNPARYIDPFVGDNQEDTPVEELVFPDGSFGYLEIPKIQEMLPIYLGASEENMAKGVAQLEKTSLPVGGLGTHSVLVGHRGYYAATIFRYLDQLVAGDRFYIYVFSEKLTYEVKDSEVVDPYRFDKFNIDPNEDQVTLLTCTPYRVSTHRLLVHAFRVYDEPEQQIFQSTIDETAEESVEAIINVPEASLLAVDDKSAEPAEGSISEQQSLKLSEVPDEKGTKITASSKAKSIDSASNAMKIKKILPFLIVVIGSLVWVFVFSLLIRTFVPNSGAKRK